MQAAKWQVEQSNIDAARALMQRCVNYNKTSILAWSEVRTCLIVIPFSKCEIKALPSYLNNSVCLAFG